jgi:Cu(I)/Ag(I) efflux system membrane fusion protein
MKKNYLAILFAIILAAGLLVYFIKPGPGRPPREASPKTATAKTESAPEQQQNPSGGTAPVKAEGPAQQDDAEEAPTVEIPVDKQRMIGVKTVEAGVKPLQHVIRTVGRIEYDEKRLSTVNTKIEGWIEKLFVDYTGKYVRKGEPLAAVYSPELVATQQEFLNVLKWAGQTKGAQNGNMQKMLSSDAEVILEAARQRLRLWDISEKQISEIEKTGKTLRTLTIYSPVDGYVVQKMALQGMKVMPGEKLFDVADLSRVWIIADIYEYELPLINIGRSAAITLSYFPGREFNSRIDYVYPTLSAETRTIKVRFAIPNPGEKLKPQMFTNVEIKVDLGKRLAIPDDAVMDTGVRQIVYVDKGDGYFEPREVKLGLRAEGFREVLAGLKAGEKVASAATFLIDSEAQLKGVVPLEGRKN